MCIIEEKQSSVKIRIELREVGSSTFSIMYAVEVFIYGEGFAKSVEYLSAADEKSAKKLYEERLDYYNL